MVQLQPPSEDRRPVRTDRRGFLWDVAGGITASAVAAGLPRVLSASEGTEAVARDISYSVADKSLKEVLSAVHTKYVLKQDPAFDVTVVDALLRLSQAKKQHYYPDMFDRDEFIVNATKIKRELFDIADSIDARLKRRANSVTGANAWTTVDVINREIFEKHKFSYLKDEDRQAALTDPDKPFIHNPSFYDLWDPAHGKQGRCEDLMGLYMSVVDILNDKKGYNLPIHAVLTTKPKHAFARWIDEAADIHIELTLDRPDKIFPKSSHVRELSRIAKVDEVEEWNFKPVPLGALTAEISNLASELASRGYKGRTIDSLFGTPVKQKDVDLGIECLWHAARYSPEYPHTHSMLADMYCRYSDLIKPDSEGRIRGREKYLGYAITSMGHAIKHYPDNRFYYEQRAGINHRLSRLCQDDEKFTYLDASARDYYMAIGQDMNHPRTNILNSLVAKRGVWVCEEAFRDKPDNKYLHSIIGLYDRYQNMMIGGKPHTTSNESKGDVYRQLADNTSDEDPRRQYLRKAVDEYADSIRAWKSNANQYSRDYAEYGIGEVHFKIGIAFSDRGDNTEAVRHYKEGLRLTGIRGDRSLDDMIKRLSSLKSEDHSPYKTGVAQEYDALHVLDEISKSPQAKARFNETLQQE